MCDQPEATNAGCIACGEANDGGYEVEDGPGPFCAGCWERLEAHFTPAASLREPPQEPHVQALLRRAETWMRNLFDYEVSGGLLTEREDRAQEIIRSFLVCMLPLPSPPASAPAPQQTTNDDDNTRVDSFPEGEHGDLPRRTTR